LQADQLIRPTDLVSGSTKIARIRGDQIEFELEKAERGMALPYDVGQLRNRLREARKRKVSAALKARRGECPGDAQGRCRRAHRYVMISHGGALKARPPRRK
jgi:hypothetical protein